MIHLSSSIIIASCNFSIYSGEYRVKSFWTCAKSSVDCCSSHGTLSLDIHVAITSRLTRQSVWSATALFTRKWTYSKRKSFCTSALTSRVHEWKNSAASYHVGSRCQRVNWTDEEALAHWSDDSLISSVDNQAKAKTDQFKSNHSMSFFIDSNWRNLNYCGDFSALC